MAQTEKATFPCFRCGVCCSGYQVQMTISEARALAGNLQVTWQTFMNDNLDPRWPGRDTVVIRHEFFKCAFLEQPPGSVLGLCRIQAFKPVACQVWRASPDKKECRQGLSRFWNLSIDENGRLNGSPDDIKSFTTFVHAVTQEEK